jgi:two-component system phosphate regulon response regulator OmpR
MNTQPTLLVIDDDRRLRELLSQFLNEHGYAVSTAANAAQARSHIACQEFDLLIVDIMMPGESGTEFVQSLRHTLTVPILMLSACAELQDKIHHLEIGADDYMTKPFEPTELLARVRSLLRRTQLLIPKSQGVMSFGPYNFNIHQGILLNAGGTVYLTSTEVILLRTLAQRPNQPFSRRELAQRMGHQVSERSVDVQITRLRKKIDDDPRRPHYIQTIRHIGYALCPDSVY